MDYRTHLSNTESSVLFSSACEPHQPSVVSNKRTSVCDVSKSSHKSLMRGEKRGDGGMSVEGVAKETRQNHCFLSRRKSCGIKTADLRKHFGNDGCPSKSDSKHWFVKPALPPVILYKHKLPWQLSDSEYYPAPLPDPRPPQQHQQRSDSAHPSADGWFSSDSSPPLTPPPALLSQTNLGSKCINN